MSPNGIGRKSANVYAGRMMERWRREAKKRISSHFHKGSGRVECDLQKKDLKALFTIIVLFTGNCAVYQLLFSITWCDYPACQAYWY